MLLLAVASFSRHFVTNSRLWEDLNRMLTSSGSEESGSCASNPVQIAAHELYQAFTKLDSSYSDPSFPCPERKICSNLKV